MNFTRAVSAQDCERHPIHPTKTFSSGWLTPTAGASPSPTYCLAMWSGCLLICSHCAAKQRAPPHMWVTRFHTNFCRRHRHVVQDANIFQYMISLPSDNIGSQMHHRSKQKWRTNEATPRRTALRCCITRTPQTRKPHHMQNATLKDTNSGQWAGDGGNK